MATFTDITHVSAKHNDYTKSTSNAVWILVAIEVSRWIYDALVVVFSN